MIDFNSALALDLSQYATQSWVNNQDFATQTWVRNLISSNSGWKYKTGLEYAPSTLYASSNIVFVCGGNAEMHNHSFIGFKQGGNDWIAINGASFYNSSSSGSTSFNMTNWDRQTAYLIIYT